MGSGQQGGVRKMKLREVTRRRDKSVFASKVVRADRMDSPILPAVKKSWLRYS